MKLVIEVDAGGPEGRLNHELAFRYDEQRSLWIAASDAIPLSQEVIIGVHAEVDDERRYLQVLFLQESARLASFIGQLSDHQCMSFLHSAGFQVSAVVNR